MTFSLFGLLAGCGCPTFSSLNVQDVDGEASTDELARVTQAAQSFVEWSARDGVCVDTIEITAEADADHPDAIGAYYGPGKPIRIELGAATPLAHIVWHELGHALNEQDQIALTHGRAFGTRDVPEDYVGAEARLDEAFARAVEPGPPPSALVEALAETCGDDAGVDQILLDTVYPGSVEDFAIGTDSGPQWERIATLGGAIFDVAPFEDADGASGLIGVSKLAEADGHRYTFRRLVLSWDGELPRIVESGKIEIAFTSPEGSAKLLTALDGAPVVLLSEDAEHRSLAQPIFASSSWYDLPLPGLVAALADGGAVSFANGAVWWDVPNDGFGLQAATLAGAPVAIGSFEDGLARPPYARGPSVGSVYAQVWNDERSAFDARLWDGQAWEDADAPRGLQPAGSGEESDEVAIAVRSTGRGPDIRATALRRTGGGWTLLSQSCGEDISPVLVAGEWYGTRMDASSLALYHLKL